jgi:hypothetical protein
MRDTTLTADEKMEKIIALDKKNKKKGLAPRQEASDVPPPKPGRQKRVSPKKATLAIKDEPKASSSQPQPEPQPQTQAPPRAGPPMRGKKPTIRLAPLARSVAGTAPKPKAKARGRPRKAAVQAMPEPEFA